MSDHSNYGCPGAQRHPCLTCGGEGKYRREDYDVLFSEPPRLVGVAILPCPDCAPRAG